MSQILPFILFAFVASITPGPTNVLILSNSARYGWCAAMPLVFGACAGAAAIVLLVGLGLGELLLKQPVAQHAMAWLGVGWISWLAWQLWRSPGATLGPDGSGARVGALGGAGLQLVNPKTWMMALAVVSLFSVSDAGLGHYLLYALVFFLVAVPCLFAWAALGRGAVHLLRSAEGLRCFNRSMALLLLVSAWSSLLI